MLLVLFRLHVTIRSVKNSHWLRKKEPNFCVQWLNIIELPDILKEVSMPLFENF